MARTGQAAARAIKNLASVLGLAVAGDLGPFTSYTSRRKRKVFYARSPPLCGPTQAQINQRSRFGEAQANWMKLTDSEKQQWEELMLRLSLCATGQNAWISLSLRPDDGAIAAAIRKSGISVTLPPPIK